MKKPVAILAMLVSLIAARAQALSDDAMTDRRIAVGAERMELYLPRLAGRRVGVVTNHTGMVGARHLVDTLLSRGVRVELIFAPEHGFRGTAAAGEHVESGHDAATGLPVVSLYGANRKPRAEDVARCDVVLFDIQDVGCRFYTYLSTMHYVMEACAEGGVPLVVLDRPNPNMYVDGPVMETAHRSFVGMHPIPVVHGMTLGELARMINGEGWLSGGTKESDGAANESLRCDLTVIPCGNYTRGMRYRLPIAPSPALPNMRAVLLYPSLCYFEATSVSLGRGTDAPFQRLTYPDGTAVDLRVELSDEEIIARGIDLSYLINARCAVGDTPKKKFLSSFFERLIGTATVRAMIEAGRTAEEIEASWAPGIAAFRERRKPYLIYEE